MLRPFACFFHSPTASAKFQPLRFQSARISGGASRPSRQRRLPSLAFGSCSLEALPSGGAQRKSSFPRSSALGGGWHWHRQVASLSAKHSSPKQPPQSAFSHKRRRRGEVLFSSEASSSFKEPMALRDDLRFCLHSQPINFGDGLSQPPSLRRQSNPKGSFWRLLRA